MDLNARVDINFARVDVNLQNRARKQEVGHCYLILLQIFFHLIILKIKVQLMLYTNFSQLYKGVLEKKLI